MTGRHDCSTGKIEEADIHDIALALIRQQVALAELTNSRRKENAKSAQLTAADIKGEIHSLRKMSEKAHASKMSLWESYRAGDVSKETFHNEGEKITKQASRYTDKISELEAKLKTIELSTGEENIFVERYIKQTGISELTQSVVDELIKEVIDGKVKKRPKDEWAVTHDTHEAIISEDIWEKAQAIFGSRKEIKMPSEPKSVLTGILTCAYCNKKLVFESRKNPSFFYCHNFNMGLGCEKAVYGKIKLQQKSTKNTALVK